MLETSTAEVTASKATGPAHLKYRPDIDGLRALAVLAVVGFHAFPGLVRGGFVGVDIFFVISGFLISNIVFGSLEKGRFSFQEFYARRIKRIFPALMLVLFSCLAAGRIFLLADECKQLGKHVAAGTAFVSNILLWTEAGYFDKAAELKPLLHLWSLGIEEQFYLLWPPIVVLAWRRKSLLGALLFAMLGISFAINIAEVHTNPVAAFYLPFSRMWELLAGCGLAYITSHKPFPKRVGNISSVIGFLLIACALAGLNKDTSFPGWAALLPTGGAFLLIFAGPEAWINRHILSSRAAVFVGLISYPLYLWHWPLLSFARIILSKEPDPATTIIIVEVGVLLAWLTYRILEKPIRVSRTFRVPLALAGTAVIAAAVGSYVNLTNGMAGRGARVAVASVAKSTATAPLSTETKTIAPTPPAIGDGPEKTVEGVPEPVAVKSPEEVYAQQQEQFLWIEKGYNSTPACMAQFLIEVTNHDDKCEIFDGLRQPTVALLGDSHANAMFSGLAKYYASAGENLVNLGRGGCLPFWGVNTEIKPNGTGTDCEKFMDRFLDYAARSQIIHTVLLANFGKVYIDGGDRPVVSSMDPANKAASFVYQRELTNTIRRLQAAKKKVILVMDNPLIGIDPHACIARPAAGSPALSKCAAPQTEVDARMRPYRRIMYDVLANFPTAGYIDVTPAFCDGKDCWAMKNDMLLYRDKDHLSHDGSLYFAPSVKILKGGLNPALISSRKALGPDPAPSGPQPPSVLSVSPSSGTGSSQPFSATLSGPRGAGTIKSAVILFNSVINGAASCFLQYERAQDQLYLMKNDGSVWQGPSKLGSGSPLSNSQCSVNAAESSSSVNNNQITIQAPVTFAPAFSGAKSIYAQVFDDSGLSGGWQFMGTWTVP